MTTKQDHETTGTARRAAHHMSGRGLVFQVAAEVQSLRRDLEFTSAAPRHPPRWDVELGLEQRADHTPPPLRTS